MNSSFEFSPIAVLGSTGSVGEQALDVARASGVPVHAICANRSVKRVEEQIREFRPAICAMADEDAAAALRTAVADTPTRIYAGEEGICRMIAESDAETVVNAIIGEAGLRSTLTTLEQKKKLALANKLIDEGVPRTVAAMQIGYENYSNFYRIYQKHFGTPPSFGKKA